MEITNEKKLLFRASRSGSLMTNGRGSVVTAKQYETYETLLKRQDDFNNGIPGVKPLTDNMKNELLDISNKINAPFQLSDTAKSFVRDMWLYREKGIKRVIKSKYLEKGTYNEEEAIALISRVDKRYYKKNKKNKNNGVLSGECDVIYRIGKKKIVIDTKCSWDVFTFMSSGEDHDYEWQGRIYMELFDCDEFHLKYVLLDCPNHLYEDEKRKLMYKYGIIDDTLEEHKELFDQFHKNYVYSDNPAFNEEERVKTIIYKRDDTKIEELYDRIKHAIEYYNKITLNGVND